MRLGVCGVTTAVMASLVAFSRYILFVVLVFIVAVVVGVAVVALARRIALRMMTVMMLTLLLLTHLLMADGQRGQGEIAHRRGAQRGHVRRGELHSFSLLLLLLLLVSGAECGLCRRSALAKRLGGVVRTVEESARRRFGVVERTLRSVQLIAAAAANQRWPTDRIHLLARVAALQNGDGLSLLLMLLLMTSCARRGRLFAVMSRLGRRKRRRVVRRQVHRVETAC